MFGGHNGDTALYIAINIFHMRVQTFLTTRNNVMKQIIIITTYPENCCRLEREQNRVLLLSLFIAIYVQTRISYTNRTFVSWKMNNNAHQRKT